MEEKKMMVKEKQNKKRTKEEKKEEERKKWGNFLKSKGRVGLLKKEKTPLSVWWFRLNDLGSSHDSQNNLIHNWCIGWC
jgi:hypothetical protein